MTGGKYFYCTEPALAYPAPLTGRADTDACHRKRQPCLDFTFKKV